LADRRSHPRLRQRGAGGRDADPHRRAHGSAGARRLDAASVATPASDGLPDADKDRLTEALRLGLAIARGLVEEHGGVIRALPAEANGRGMRIELELSLANPERPV
jgi:hypothetical protein